MKAEMIDRYHQNYRVVGKLLQNARKAAGFTQDEVADVMGFSQPWVSKTEHGVRKVRLFELQDLALLYGVTVDELLPTPEQRTELDLTPEDVQSMVEEEED